MNKKDRHAENLRVAQILETTLQVLREMRPGDKSTEDRVYAICITDMEKVVALFKVNVVGPVGG